ncbi:MAG: GIY-YIG nuclease family protein [Candidatus Bathyarchaeota archaeon]
MSNSKLPARPGIYTLIIDVAQPVKVGVGRLGFRNFSQGFYTYTGSAVGRPMNLRIRISRHLTFEKKRRWHIDYLLSSKGVVIRAVVFVETHLKRECQIAKSIDQTANVKTLIKGFGSSDCRNGCASHLHYVLDLPLEAIILQVNKIYEQVFSDSLPIHILHI